MAASMKVLLAVVFLPFIFGSSVFLDITETAMVDMPPPTQEELDAVDKLENLELWPNRDDEYGSIGPKAQLLDVEIALSHASEPEESVKLNAESGGDAPLDLLDVDLNSLVPKINTRKQRHLRSVLRRLRAKLRPLHARICRGSYRSCLSRRRANARILDSMVRRGCHVRVNRCSAKKLSAASSRKLRRKQSQQGLGTQKLSHVSRVYTYLRRTYTRLYIRYALLLSKFYRRKFKTLANIFIHVMKKLKWESQQAKKKNREFTATLARLRNESQAMRVRTTRIHNEQKAALAKLGNEHTTALKKSVNDIREVQAQLRVEKMATERLRKQLSDLEAKRRREEEALARWKADSEKVTDAAKTLGNHVKRLLVEIGTVSNDLRNAQRRVDELENLKNTLIRNRSLLREILSRTNAAMDANDRAAARIQTSYNSLLNRYNQLNSGDEGARQALQAAIDGLRADIQKQAKRCVPDACGICNGDESTCAYTSARGTCISAGDPHFRSFDGVSFDYQQTGQFILARHGNPVNFEVQAMQRSATVCCPRINKGIAVRGGRNVVVIYIAWGTRVVLVNGKQTLMPLGQWQRVGPGLTVYRNSDSQMIVRYENSRRQVVDTTLYYTNWGGGAFISVYINVPWQWSSGRSLWGLCGDFDAWSGDDGVFINRNVNRIFAVTDSPRDLFKNPEQKSVDLEINDFTQEDIEREKRLDKLNGVLAVEDLQEFAGKLPAAPAINAAPPANAKPARVSLGVATPEMRAEAKNRCRGMTGTVQKQCEVDVLLGVPAGRTRQLFQNMNVLAKEAGLKRCALIDHNTFLAFANDRLPKSPAKQGFSLAFFFNPTSITDRQRCVLLEKGDNMFVTQVGTDLSVGVGSAQCTVKNSFLAEKWTAITVSVKTDGNIEVFVNSNLACSGKGNGSIPSNKNNLIAGSADSSDACDGRMAHLYYIPQTVTVREAALHGRLDPMGCKHPKGPSAEEELLEEQEDNDE